MVKMKFYRLKFILVECMRAFNLNEIDESQVPVQKAIFSFLLLFIQYIIISFSQKVNLLPNLEVENSNIKNSL